MIEDTFGSTYVDTFTQVLNFNTQFTNNIIKSLKFKKYFRFE